MNGFGILCPECVDFVGPAVAKSVKLHVEDPTTGETTATDHAGPAIVAPPGHVMVVHRGHREPVTVGEGQIISLCEGDVVRILQKPER